MSKKAILTTLIEKLIQRINRRTGKSDTDLTSGVKSLIAGYGSGNGDAILYDGLIEINGEPAKDVIDHYQDGYDKGYAEGLEAGGGGGKNTLYGTYILKEAISADELPSINVTQNLAEKGVRAYFRMGTNNYISREVEKITFKASGEPRFSVRSKSAYSEEWDITSYGLTEYESSTNQWVSKYYLNDSVSTYNTDTKSRIITFAEPITVSEAFYNAFSTITDISTDIYIEGENKGIEQGKKAQYDEFWDSYQENGKRKSYAFAFSGIGWTAEIFKPKYDIRPITSCRYMFATITRMRGIDIEQTFKDSGITFDTSGVKETDGFDYFVQYSSPSVLPVISTIGTSQLRYCFNHPSELITIRKLILKDDGSQTFRNVFDGCTKLENLEIEGTIGKNGLNLQWSTKLSKASWVSIVSHYSTTTSGLSMTGSLDSVNSAFETSEGANDGSTSAEWLNLMATKPNVSFNLV